MREQSDSLDTSKKHRTLRQAIQRSLLLLGFGVGIIGLCGLATITSEATNPSDPGLSASWKSVDHTPAHKTTSSALNAETFSTVAPLAEPASSTASQKASSHVATKKVSSCNAQKRSFAITTKKKALTTENNRHTHMVGWLKATGSLTRYFFAGMYSAKLQAEAKKHSSITGLILREYHHSLKAASCNS